jgi:hypothetical protein
MKNTNAPVVRNADDVCSEVFKLTTWDYGLDQPIPGRAVFNQGAAGACGHDQPDSCGSGSISEGSSTAVDRW